MCEEASRGDGHPMPNSSQFVFPDDRRARGVQQVVDGRIERRLEVFSDQAMHGVSQHSRVRAGGEHSSIYFEAWWKSRL